MDRTASCPTFFSFCCVHTALWLMKNKWSHPNAGYRPAHRGWWSSRIDSRYAYMRYCSSLSKFAWQGLVLSIYFALYKALAAQNLCCGVKSPPPPHPGTTCETSSMENQSIGLPLTKRPPAAIVESEWLTVKNPSCSPAIVRLEQSTYSQEKTSFNIEDRFVAQNFLLDMDLFLRWSRPLIQLLRMFLF